MKKQSPIHKQHQNQIRIIGGTLRGRKLTFPSAEGLRPTPDSVRERLFNWLGQDLTGQIVLDLFAGSGALSFESLSRHAKQVIACETHRVAVQNLRQFATQFQVADRFHIHQQDGLQFLYQTTQHFDLVLLDPPFAWQNWTILWQHLRNKLNNDALVYIEAGTLPDIPIWLTSIKQGRAGQSHYALLKQNITE